MTPIKETYTAKDREDLDIILLQNLVFKLLTGKSTNTES